MAVAPDLVVSERVLEAVRLRLAGDPTLDSLLGPGDRIHLDAAGQTEPYPFVLLSGASAPDTLALTGASLFTTVSVLTKVVGRFDSTVTPAAQAAALRPIGDRIAALLQRYRVVHAGVLLVQLVRTATPYQPVEVRAGITYRYLNQLFVTQAYALPA
jgi:hypothetical protein